MSKIDAKIWILKFDLNLKKDDVCKKQVNLLFSQKDQIQWCDVMSSVDKNTHLKHIYDSDLEQKENWNAIICIKDDHLCFW